MMIRPTMPWLRVILAALGLIAGTTVDLSPAERPLPEGDVPHPEVVRLYEEVATWSGEEATDEEPASSFPQEGSLAAAVRARAESFELFCLDSDDQTSRALLADLPYGETIESAAARYQVDGLLIAAMIEAESQFDPTAVSPVGATGLMQLMPETGLELGLADLTDPKGNVEAGSRYIRRLLRQFDGDLPLALAAYNAGPTRVARYGGVPPFPETTEYVERVLRHYVGHRRAVWHGASAAASEATAEATAQADIRKDMVTIEASAAALASRR